MALISSFSRGVHMGALRKRLSAALAALPRLTLPGVSFTLYLKADSALYGAAHWEGVEEHIIAPGLSRELVQDAQLCELILREHLDVLLAQDDATSPSASSPSCASLALTASPSNAAASSGARSAWDADGVRA
eukprot:CAMPEP_0185164384 /NCGR_PEP_ID=MMETSP1139-20130426/9290_1 /TAXON_ID=298111 /ORGANISM="Pavlova sp., Strain CCMP459" /LENGTH=132 /DNA_ID=CAMNT_0027729761 /DNA_START=466 /DNA_END=864 /DNA_ORIENTATION=+